MAGALATLTADQQIEAVYIAYFNRAADSGGYVYWGNDANALVSGGILSPTDAAANIAQSFSLQPEATALYSFLASPPAIPVPHPANPDPIVAAQIDTFINAVYTNLFNHKADAAGEAYWSEQILGGQVTVGAAIYDIANGAIGNDATILNFKIAAATYFTTQTTIANIGSTVPLSTSFLGAANASVAPVVDAATQADSQTTTDAFIADGGVWPLPVPVSSYTLTPDADSITTSVSGVTFSALPFVTPGSGLGNNTLNNGDNLQDSVGDGTLTYTTTTDNGNLLPGANPAYSHGVTLNGIKTLNISNQSYSFTAGFQGATTGSITGLAVVNNNQSVNSVQLGAVGDSLATALTTYTSNGGAHQNFTAIIAAAALSGSSDAINININGDTGAAANCDAFKASSMYNWGSVPAGGTSIKLAFAPDGSKNGYETWNITSNNDAYLRLAQGAGTTAAGDFGTGIGSAANIVLAGAGAVELSVLTAGDFANLKTIDATAETAAVTLTGATANVEGGYYTAVGSDIANEAGLLTSSLNNIIAPTSIKGSLTAENFIDLSGLTATNINAITTLTGNTAAGIVNTLILPNSVVEQAGALAGESGFQIIGDVGLTTGTINLANFTDANEIQLWGGTAFNFGNVTIKNGTPTFTLDLNGQTEYQFDGFHTFTVNGPANVTDVFNLKLGTAEFANTADGNRVDLACGFSSDVIGNSLHPNATGLTVNGYETVNINVIDGGAGASILSDLFSNIPDIIFGGVVLQPTVGGGEIVNLTGTGDLLVLGNKFNPASWSHNWNPDQLYSSIEYWAAGSVDNSNNMVINAHQTGLLAFSGTNALVINGADSGGIWMVGGTETNELGATITGSATGFNLLVGGGANDTFTGGTGQSTPVQDVEGDVFATNGGADTINLATGHTLNHINIYGTNGFQELFGGLFDTTFNYLPTPGSITDWHNNAQPGWWGVKYLGSASEFGALGTPGTPGLLSTDPINKQGFTYFGVNSVDNLHNYAGGTSASQSVVNDFIIGSKSAGGDVIDFAPKAWGVSPDSTYVDHYNTVSGGLVQGDGQTAVDVWQDANFGAGPLVAGAGPGPTIAHDTTVVEIGAVLNNADALAQYLKGNVINFYPNGIGGVLADTNVHMLFAYSDANNNIHISDVNFVNVHPVAPVITAPVASVIDPAPPGTETATNQVDIIAASDLVELVGATTPAVGVAALNTHNIHFLG